MSSSSHHHLSGYSVPSDILIKIFSNVDFRRKVKMAQVCHKWRNIIYDDVTWTNTKVKVKMVDIDEQYMDTIIPSLVRRNISGVALNLGKYDEAKSNAIKNTIL